MDRIIDKMDENADEIINKIGNEVEDKSILEVWAEGIPDYIV